MPPRHANLRTPHVPNSQTPASRPDINNTPCQHSNTTLPKQPLRPTNSVHLPKTSLPLGLLHTLLLLVPPLLLRRSLSDFLLHALNPFLILFAYGHFLALRTRKTKARIFIRPTQPRATSERRGGASGTGFTACHRRRSFIGYAIGVG